jgi:hypothetical protein
MDGSYLSNAAVVEASRKFVCIRLATYEDAGEAKFMESVFLPRAGLLENTTFGILSPDGKRRLTASGRGPMHAFRGSADMARSMNEISQQFVGARLSGLIDNQLPLMESVEVALNVAACDNLPLVVTFSSDQQQLDKLNSDLLGVAWSESLAGQFVYATASDTKRLKPILGIEIDTGVLVVEPGQYGLSGKTLAQLKPTATREQMQAALAHVVNNFARKPASTNAHIALGIQLGIEWKSEIPETDQQSLRAKERARGGR